MSLGHRNMDYYLLYNILTFRIFDVENFNSTISVFQTYVCNQEFSYIAETWDMHGYPRHATYFPGWRERKRTNFNFIDNHSLNTSKQNHSILRYRRYATTIKFDLRHQLFLKKKNKTNFFYTSGKKLSCGG